MLQCLAYGIYTAVFCIKFGKPGTKIAFQKTLSDGLRQNFESKIPKFSGKNTVVFTENAADFSYFTEFFGL